MEQRGSSPIIDKDTAQKTPSDANPGHSRPIPPKRPPGPKQRKSGAQQPQPRSRTANACEGCRKRKTKCSGPPGPCGICTGLDTTCIFKPKSHRRRRYAHSADANPEKQKYMLDGMFLILKHNTPQDIHTLVQLIRNNAQSRELFHCIRNNLRSLQERSLIDTCEVDDRDFYALAPSSLLQSRANEKDTLQQGALKGASSKAESWSTDPDAPSFSSGLGDKAGILSPNQPETWKPLPTHSPTYNDANEFFEALGIDDQDSLYNVPLSGAASSGQKLSHTPDTKSVPFVEQSFRYPATDVEHISASILNPLSALAMSTSTGLPVSAPASTLDHFTLVFINYAHQLMSTGTTLHELNNFGTPNCELLFRNREHQDKFTIPNWACETARHFPSELLPTTRIALALCLMRLIPYLICPSPETLNALPGMLRPTDLQKRLAHRIEHNFIPFPKLRDCIIDYASSPSSMTDWIVLLAEHTCRVGWSSTYTDMTSDTRTQSPESLSAWTEETHRKWACEQETLIKQQLFLQERDSHPFSDSQQNEVIVRNLKTGECHISSHFERACWKYENWSVSKSLLSVWPDFSGHIKVH